MPCRAQGKTIRVRTAHGRAVDETLRVIASATPLVEAVPRDAVEERRAVRRLLDCVGASDPERRCGFNTARYRVVP
jgi:tetrahydromethanopterin S-methyltransferase subunit A